MAVKKASPLELSAVSTESWTTPMIKPTATACMATSFPMPRKEQAMGMSSSEPPATPEVKAQAGLKLHEWFGDFDDKELDLFFEKKD